VLIDTKLLLQARHRPSAQCRELLARCEQGALNDVITLPTRAEFSHRAMIQEAQSKGWCGSSPSGALSERPERVRQLSAYADSVRDLLDCALLVAEWQAQDMFVSLDLQKQHGLLTNDSINLAIARRHALKGMATAAKAFDHVPGVIV
jgi:predicted nucleic acid-binding protein